MSIKEYTFLDTDLQIHRLTPDPAVREEAEKIFKSKRPSAMSAFSLVELKGNYISSLILMHRKISDSDSFERAYARIQNSGGRKSVLMLGALISWLGTYFEINPWEEARQELITHIDAQIAASWEEFIKSVDYLADNFKCSRALEEPKEKGDKWTAVISQCRKENTKCTIVEFMKRYNKELKRLVDTLSKLDLDHKTKELYRIEKIAVQTLKDRFPWEGVTCRRVGDLLIGLQSKSGKELISSNYREHSYLCEPLEYNFCKFPVAHIRSK